MDNTIKDLHTPPDIDVLQKTTVWLLWHYYYEDSEVLGIYLTQQAAQRDRDRLIQGNTYLTTRGHELVIAERPVGELARWVVYELEQAGSGE